MSICQFEGLGFENTEKNKPFVVRFSQMELSELRKYFNF